jgi:hypothetical protein
MRIIKTTLVILSVITMSSCASGYKVIAPENIKYVSINTVDNVKLEYKYDLLVKKYNKKEVKEGVKVVAIKITNNSDKDLMFGRELTLRYADDTELYIMESDRVFKTLKQSPASYLWYLLLSPMNLYTTGNDGQQTSSTPIGLAIGPGLAGGNMITAGSANKKFKNELLDYDINGTIIKKGETKYGLIGVIADSFDAIKLKLE